MGILNQLPGGIHWVRLLWFNLYLLGIDSAFSGVEGILIVLRDTALFQGVTNWKLAGGLCINFMFLLVGFLETFAAGWINGLEDQIKSIGLWANISFCIANFGSIILSCCLWFGLDKNLWDGIIGLIIFYALFTALAIFFVIKKSRKTVDVRCDQGFMTCSS